MSLEHRLLLLFVALAAAACSGAPKPLPDLPPPEYEPSRSIDLNPKPVPSAAPVAPSAPGAPAALPAPGAPAAPATPPKP